MADALEVASERLIEVLGQNYAVILKKSEAFGVLTIKVSTRLEAAEQISEITLSNAEPKALSEYVSQSIILALLKAYKKEARRLREALENS